MTPVTPVKVGTSQRRRCETSARAERDQEADATEETTSTRCSSVGVT